MTFPEIEPLVTAVKVAPLLACPLTVTVTGPVVTPPGAVATMDVALQLVTEAGKPLNRTTLVPCVAPKFWPVMVTAEPAVPEEGDKLVMLGPEETVKATPLLVTPPAVTVTFPVVAPAGTGATMLPSLQLKGVASVPLNCTVLVPCGMPNPEPLMVTEVLKGPLVGVIEVMAGGGITVKFTEFDAPA
jgi:hypothetical protein